MTNRPLFLYILKQFSLTTLLLATTVVVSGQITEEKVYRHSVHLATIDSAENAYTYFNTLDTTVSIYSLNHKLISRVSLKIPQGHSFVNCYSFYRRVFDQDDGIEHLTLLHDNLDRNSYSILIHDDDGSILMSFDSIITSQVLSTTQGAKLMINRYTLSQGILNHIYRLPGKIPTQKPAPFEESALEIYPNPAVNSVELAYQLPENQTTGKIHVYYVKGNLMETVLVGPAFREVEIDVSSYPSGLYIAKLNEREVKKFVVQK